jgi:hypothetical protein
MEQTAGNIGLLSKTEGFSKCGPLTINQLVVGSNPARGTTFLRHPIFFYMAFLHENSTKMD